MSRQAKALRLSLLLKRFKEKRRQRKAEIAALDNQISYWADNDNGRTSCRGPPIEPRPMTAGVSHRRGPADQTARVAAGRVHRPWAWPAAQKLAEERI